MESVKYGFQEGADLLQKGEIGFQMLRTFQWDSLAGNIYLCEDLYLLSVVNDVIYHGLRYARNTRFKARGESATPINTYMMSWDWSICP